MLNVLLVAALIMTVIGLVLGLVIGFFARVFRVDNDPRVELVTELLPGANCGGCGKAGCSDFAKSVVAGENSPNKCPVSSAETISNIARALGIEVGEGFKQCAVVACGGDISQVQRQVHYNGITDCASAALIGGGPKNCKYGCLGMGSCARHCPFGAIEMVNGLAVIHKEICVGCGKCVAACPRGVIKLVPADSTAHVYCNSPDKGVAKKQNCKVPCIGCRKCARAFPEKFTVEGFLAKVNYSAPAPTDAEVESIGCPTGALLTEKKHLEIEKNNPEWSK